MEENIHSTRRIHLGSLVNEETRVSRSIKIRPRILQKAHIKAIVEGKAVGRWIEDAIEEKMSRERRKK